MALNGIDISSWQADLVPSRMTTTAFVVVKATGGTGYSNPCFRAHADAVLDAGKLLAVYHYARERGCPGSAKAEADHFIKAFKPYINKAIPYLDWEADALSLPIAWAKGWLDRVKEKTGVTPGIYMSKSTCRAADWSSVAKKYPLWVAQYPDYEETGYQSDPWTDSNDYGAWDAPEMFQYTSSGRVAGYDGHLDLNRFFGSKADWKKRARKGEAAAKGASKEKTETKQSPSKSPKAAAKTMGINRANVSSKRSRYRQSPGLVPSISKRRYRE